jgi:hypothetical protein
MKAEEVGRKCSTQGKQEKCIYSFTWEYREDNIQMENEDGVSFCFMKTYWEV